MLHPFALGLLFFPLFPVLDKTVFFGVDSNDLNVTPSASGAETTLFLCSEASVDMQPCSGFWILDP